MLSKPYLIRVDGPAGYHFQLVTQVNEIFVQPFSLFRHQPVPDG